jgi:hypothetical protein
MYNMVALFLFLKGVTGALASFSYLVKNIRLGWKCQTLKLTTVKN